MLQIVEAQIEHIPLIADYWTNSEDAYLESLGVDLKKLPSSESFTQMLSTQINLDYDKKGAYALIALVNNIAIGHCNVNAIKYGSEAQMHLHIWQKTNRTKGYGSEMVKKSIPIFFKKLNLRQLWCEPYALNPAPNKTLLKLGFEFVKTYKTTPGSINFEQNVNQYLFKKEQLNSL